VRALLALLAAVLALALVAPMAGAASIAYVDGGSVWISSLDGAKKAKLAGPVVNSQGETEEWLAVAASDGGRIVAARNKPGRMSSFSWFKVWEPDGTSVVEGPLNAPTGWTVYVYPLGFDLTADGKTMVYGYSNSSSCCPITYARGTYVRPVTNSALAPISISGQEDPTIVGDRVVAHSGSDLNLQDAGATTYGTAFTSWLDTSAVGLELRRTDVSASGSRAALEFEQWDAGTQTVGKIAILSITAVGGSPAGDVDCFLPAAGVAQDVSLSADAATVAWTDDGGLKVAGAPVGPADPCALASPPVVISPTATQGAIGGASVDPFLAAPGGPGGPGGPGVTGTAPKLTLPRKATVRALAGKKGLAIKVRVAGAGKVTIKATVPAKRLGRKGKPVLVAKGSAKAKRAGKVTVRLRLTKAGRKKVKRLVGARLTLRVTQGGLTATRRLTLH
jgi:hypothetical protein